MKRAVSAVGRKNPVAHPEGAETVATEAKNQEDVPFPVRLIRTFFEILLPGIGHDAELIWRLPVAFVYAYWGVLAILICVLTLGYVRLA